MNLWHTYPCILDACNIESALLLIRNHTFLIPPQHLRSAVLCCRHGPCDFIQCERSTWKALQPLVARPKIYFGKKYQRKHRCVCGASKEGCVPIRSGRVKVLLLFMLAYWKGSEQNLHFLRPVLICLFMPTWLLWKWVHIYDTRSKSDALVFIH